MPLHAPKYIRPQDAAQSRAQMKRRLIWVAVAIPAVFIFLAFGYSDSAPAFLRSGIVAVDRAFGYPIIGLLSMIFGVMFGGAAKPRMPVQSIAAS